MSRVQVRSTYFPIEQIASERRAWRLRKVQFFEREERRDRRVNGLCEQSWRNFCEALHREVIQRNDLGRPILGICRSEDRIEVHPAGKLAAFLVVELDREKAKHAARSLLHEG